MSIATGALGNYEGDTKPLLDRVKYAACSTSDHLLALLTSVIERKDPALPRLVVVDSISNLFRCVDASKRKESKQQLQQTMLALQQLTKRDVAVVITNEVTADFNAIPGSAKTFKPAGGKSITKYLTARLQCIPQRNSRNYRKCSRVTSNGAVMEDFPFVISEDGIKGIGDDD